MCVFLEQLWLAEKAVEDIYFARVNRELIVALHKQLRAEKNTCQPSAHFSTSIEEEEQCH